MQLRMTIQWYADEIRIAIVGRHEVGPVIACHQWDEV